MLLLDDDDELPLVPSEEETALEARLGVDGIAAIDEAIMSHVSETQYKVARVIHRAIETSGLSLRDDDCVDLHARRLIALVAAGRIEAFGNTRQPRWSEVRLPKSG